MVLSHLKNTSWHCTTLSEKQKTKTSFVVIIIVVCVCTHVICMCMSACVHARVCVSCVCVVCVHACTAHMNAVLTEARKRMMDWFPGAGVKGGCK